MLLTILIIFAIAAIGGLVLASFVLRGEFAPWLVGGLHALIAALGLVLLVLLLIDEGAGNTRLVASFALLLIAALFGFGLGALHLRKQLPPKAVVLVHAGFAVAGVVTLLTLVV